jgi:hypothetical protein
MSDDIPDDLSIPPFLNRNTTPASDEEALPEIRLEAYNKLDHWRDELDRTTKMKKRDVFERAAADLFLEAEYEHNLAAVQAIADAIYVLGRDHTGLNDDDIQYIMDGAKAKAERPINDRAALGRARGADEEPPPPNGPADYYSNGKTDELGATHDQADKQSEPGKVYWHGQVDYRASRPYLVQDVIPEVGHGLISGQWGTFKTFGALELAHSCMSGEPWLGYEVMRHGGVLFIALEGAGEVPIRLQGVIEHRGKIEGPAPFAWIETCPPLIGKNAADEICAIAEPIAGELKARFGVPLVLIVIDTIIAGAGYTRDGQDNDAAAGQVVMNTLKAVAKRIGCFVTGIDHFGKAVETGTRGTSAKEGSADVVIAMLGDKSVSGEVTNTRLALRKRRGGPNGEEHPFTTRKVDMDPDQFGKPMSTLVLDWRTAQDPQPAAKERWTKSLRLLRQVLMTILADHGCNCQPYADGPTVRACDLELVRQEFYRQHPADGDEKQKTATRRQAFHRAIKAAQDASLIALRELNGVQLVWLTKPEA